jgi:CheY-like chemotaxis protein
MRILVVDDNQGFLQLMGTLLRDYGFAVVLAEDGKQARELMEQEPVDLIISDVFMPTLDGVRFHSYVRDFMDASDLPFIFVSGYDDEHTRNLVKDSNIDYFFSKTTPLEKLVDLIEKLRPELRTAQA